MLDNIYKDRIRPIAISIIRNNNKVLVYERKDDITGEKFYRLIGGCIEFGEKSDEALMREFLEELNLKIHDINLLTTFETMFRFNEKELHEIVFLFESKFLDKGVYDKESIPGLEGERAFKAIWMNIEDFRNNKYLIYPEEVRKYL